MNPFESLLGAWRVEGEIPIDPPMKVLGEVTFTGLGEFIVEHSVAEPGMVPDSLSIIGGAPASEPQPMHYFDSRGVKRQYLTTLEGPTWTIWRAPGEDVNGPDGPGFDQRFIGELSADGRTIDARWERGTGTKGDDWELDFPLTYTRR